MSLTRANLARESWWGSLAPFGTNLSILHVGWSIRLLMRTLRTGSCRAFLEESVSLLNWVSPCGDRDFTDGDRITALSTFHEEIPYGIHGAIISPSRARLRRSLDLPQLPSGCYTALQPTRVEREHMAQNDRIARALAIEQRDFAAHNDQLLREVEEQSLRVQGEYASRGAGASSMVVAALLDLQISRLRALVRGACERRRTMCRTVPELGSEDQLL